MVEWLAGNRIRGTSTERNTTCGFNYISAISGGWKEVGRTTLGSAGDAVDITSLPDKRYYMVLANIINSGNAQNKYRLNGDTGSNYANRYSTNGGSDSTFTCEAYFSSNPHQGSFKFSQLYISNVASNEKLVHHHSTSSSGSAASSCPERIFGVAKWANTSDVIDEFNMFNGAGGDYASGTEVVVLGYDPDDTHTDNFWEPLADITLGSDASEISSGTITAKKYLWVQVYFQNASNSDDVLVRFNNDTSSNYSHRHAINYGSDTTQTSGSSIKLIDRNAGADQGRFANFFIVNNSAVEKLLIAHGVEEETAGASNPPTSNECVGKWANTSSQITEIDCFTNSGNIRSGARLIVWGSD
jgi:hypothetical protein